MYKLTHHNMVIRQSDNVFIPMDIANRDFAEYLLWIAEGNNPEPADPEPVHYPQFSVREFLALFTYEEKLAVKAATRTSDEIGLWYDEMLAAEYITADAPATVNGLAALASANLLTAERLAEITEAMQPVTATYL